MHSELKRIFGTSIAVGTENVPTAHLRYRGKSNKFLTWQIIGADPRLSADDEQIESAYEVDLDFFSDGDYTEMQAAGKALMKQNGYVWVEDSPEMYEEDTGLYHITSTFEKGRSL